MLREGFDKLSPNGGVMDSRLRGNDKVFRAVMACLNDGFFISAALFPRPAPALRESTHQSAYLRSISPLKPHFSRYFRL
jgi:hypothetical protein